MIMSKHRAETDLLEYVAAAEHLADVAELRSPTAMLTEALRQFRRASERLRNPVRDIRPAADVFGRPGAPTTLSGQLTTPPGRSPSTLTPHVDEVVRLALDEGAGR